MKAAWRDYFVDTAHYGTIGNGAALVPTHSAESARLQVLGELNLILFHIQYIGRATPIPTLEGP